jgi:pimeloyl-ACP methyl ester carboxylesterase
MQTIVKNTLTNYQILGPKDTEETIVILHGWGRSYSDWIPIANQLKDRFKVILLDLPGFGSTPKPQTDWTIYDYTDYFEEFAKKLGLKNLIFIGHSFGGRIGIISASRSNLIKKLILVDSGAIEKKSLKLKAKVFIVQSLKPLTKLLPTNIQKKLKSKAGSSDYQASGEMKKIFLNTIHEDLTHLFKNIKTKTLIIWGSNDLTLPVRNAKIIKSQIKDSELRIVWEAGHHPHLDKPKEFLEILEENI